MKTAISYKQLDLREPVESEVAKHQEKLARLLKSYSPDLVQLHGAVERHPRKENFTFSVNLSLPTGNLHAESSSQDLRLSVKQAFADLAEQLKRHQSRLRKDYEWKRKRGRSVAIAD
jgi:ribosomal subunit interface protein